MRSVFLWRRLIVPLSLVVLFAGAGAAVAAGGARLGPVAVLASAVALPIVVAAVLDDTAALAVFLLGIPVAFRFVGPLQVIEYAAAFTILVVTARRLLGRQRFVPPLGPLVWGLALLAVALVAYSRSIDPEASFRAVTQLAGGFCLAWAVYAAVERFRQVIVLTVVLLLMGVIVAVDALRTADAPTADFGGAVVSGRAHGIFAQPNELGLFCAMLLAVAVGVTIAAPSLRSKAIGGGAAGALLVALAISLSRGAWLGAAVAIVVLGILLPAARRQLLLLGVPALVIGISLVVWLPDSTQVRVISERLGTLSHPSANPYDDRPSIYREALREVVARPWTGEGPGAFPAASEKWGSGGTVVSAEHAHNALLTIAAENGLIALVAVLALTISVMVCTWRCVRAALEDGRPSHAAVYAGYAAALAALAAHGVVDYPLRNSLLFLLTWFLLGLLLATARMEASWGRRSQRRVAELTLR